MFGGIFANSQSFRVFGTGLLIGATASILLEYKRIIEEVRQARQQRYREILGEIFDRDKGSVSLFQADQMARNIINGRPVEEGVQLSDEARLYLGLAQADNRPTA